MRTPEGDEKAELKKFLTSIGAYHFWPVQRGLGSATIDVLACVPALITPRMLGWQVGLFVGIEVKKEGYKPSDFTGRQIVVMREMRAANARTFSGDADEIEGHMTQWLTGLR